ncbi:MAG: glycosyltransferase [Pirellulaceae bacterium]
MSNGVDDLFFEIPLQREAKTITFVGRLEGEYLRRVKWILDEVWPALKRSNPEIQLTVAGKTADADLIRRFKSLGIQHREFVENPAELYSQQAVLIAPIFKGYGLINKVVQAMAAGTLVVGDRTAFNAIPDFESGIHGMVAETPLDFQNAIETAFTQPDLANQIRRAARELMGAHFRWGTRVEQLLDSLAL